MIGIQSMSKDLMNNIAYFSIYPERPFKYSFPPAYNYPLSQHKQKAVSLYARISSNRHVLRRNFWFYLR
jgi:hypothetical protein